jgi:hypothetical protein
MSWVEKLQPTQKNCTKTGKEEHTHIEKEPEAH